MNTQSTLGLALMLVSGTLAAHEYWLDPVDSSITRGSAAIIDVRNGENFTGSAFPFDNSKFQAVSVNSETSKTSYDGRLGDYPALNPQLNNDGLYSIHVNSTANLLSYKTWDQFNAFLDYHDLDTIKDRHNQRALPATDITERYFRSAKTLIQVNSSGVLSLDDATSVDIHNNHVFSASGSVFELLLLDNPYSNTDTVRIKLLYQNKPLIGRQVELFWKGSTLLRFTSLTNENGIASFKLLGSGDYLINAVNVVEPEDKDVHWLSYWASMTFER